MTTGYRARRISGILILSLMLALWLQLRAAYRTEVEHAGLLVQSMVHAIAQQITGSLDGIDQILVGMTDLVNSGQWDDPEQRERLLSRMHAFPEILYVAVVDSNGRMGATTLPSINLPPEGLDVAYRDYVTSDGGLPSGKARVGLPMVGRQTGERTIPLSRPLLDSAGRRQGTVVAMVSSDHYADILSSNMLDPDGASAIIRQQDGLFLARAPHQPEKFGTSVAGSELLTQWVPAAPVGVAQLVAKADGNRKFIGYRVLQNYPLVMTSGLSEAKALDSWRSMAATELAAALILSMLIFQWGWQTDRREAQMLDHQLELERKVHERTSLLADATQLAEERAERISAINTTLRGLAQVAAHQLQEPLRPIVSFTQLARRSLSSNPTVDQHLNYVEHAGLKLKATLVAFQRYTELLGGTPHRRTMDLADLAAQLADNLAEELATANATLTVGPLPPITADPAMVEVALHELVMTSIKLRHEDRLLQIKLSASAHADHWQIMVADNGEGIGESIQPRLFEAFTRHHQDDTGLGLATCRAIAEAHGGQITVASSSAGSAFTITLPRV